MAEEAVPRQRAARHAGSTFGDDPFGRFAERIARFFGTPQYIVGQTIVVIIWIIFNGYSIFVHFDPFPFILLNLAFSTQAAYAAPLILLAQTRQAERDKAHSDAIDEHREEVAQAGLQREQMIERRGDQLRELLESNTQITAETKNLAEQVEALTRQIHKRVVVPEPD
jgi:uncharacterized membrane protein